MRRLSALLSEHLAPPALAAALLVSVEWLRALLAGGDGGGAFAFGLAVMGILGLPAWIAGLAGGLTWRAVGLGWAWGRGERPPLSPARRVAWVIFSAVALAALVMVVQVQMVVYLKAFKRHVYQGLATGLTAAGVICGLAMIAGPVVGALTRAIAWIAPKLPRPLDPTRRLGVAVWLLLIAVAGAWLAPIVIKALHTVDLRPARLALLWAAALLGAHWLAQTVLKTGRWRSVGLAVGLLVPALALGSLLWGAGSLGDSAARVVAVDRDTLLTGKVAQGLRALSDKDGDGRSAAFAGGDCDDANGKVRPGVYDPPGDGVDQNCTGADLSLSDHPLRPEARGPRGPGPQNWNVLLITVDALRGDMIDEEMPTLKAFAEADAVRYTQAYSAGASTYWSVAALMTSNMPSRLMMGGDQTPVQQERMMTEVFRAADWHTALFANVTVFFVRGLRQAMDVSDYKTSDFTVHGAKPGSAHMTDGILAHLDRWQKKQVRHPSDRFFLWAHYYDPHDPYFEVPGFPAADGSDEARYRAICRSVDAQLGRLIEGLKAKGEYARTLIILTADHGDEFLEHGHRFHGTTLYEEMVHVPLIMKVPGVPARTLDTPISHIEVAPTVLELVGLEIPDDYIGRSRAAEIRTGEPAPAAPVFFEVLPDSNYKAHQVGVRLGAMKLIYRVDSHTFELFDLSADPHERRNLYGAQETPLRDLLMRYADHHLYALAQGWSRATKPEGAPKRGAPRRPLRPLR